MAKSLTPNTALHRTHLIVAPGELYSFGLVTALLTNELLPVPPETLSSGEITLRFVRVVPGEPSRGFVPYYHFRILTADGSDVGHINFRVGDTEHVRVCAGHIGFEILEFFRGHGYALQACHAIASFVRSVYEVVTITCDPDNFASMRSIAVPIRIIHKIRHA